MDDGYNDCNKEYYFNACSSERGEMQTIFHCLYIPTFSQQSCISSFLDII